MVLADTDMPTYTPFSVAAAGVTTPTALVMTQTMFAAYCARAVKRLAKEKPASITTGDETYDTLEAYLVAHYFITRDPNIAGEFQSESIPGYSYSKRSDIKAGSTYWEQRYYNELEPFQKKQPSAQCDRTDAVQPVHFNLDDNTMPVFEGTEEGGVDL